MHVPYSHPPCSLPRSFPQESSRGPVLSLDPPAQPRAAQPGCSSGESPCSPPLLPPAPPPANTRGYLPLLRRRHLPSSQSRRGQCPPSLAPAAPLPPRQRRGPAPAPRGGRGRRQRQQRPLVAGAPQAGRREKRGWSLRPSAAAMGRKSRWGASRGPAATSGAVLRKGSCSLSASQRWSLLGRGGAGGVMPSTERCGRRSGLVVLLFL